MKDKEEIFKLLRESVETPQESFAVEEMIRKVEGIMSPIETVSTTQKKFIGIKFLECTIQVQHNEKLIVSC